MSVRRQILPPPRLQSLQEEFGKSIRTPFSFATGRFACRREAYPEQAVARVAPGGGLEGSERLALYNEQYWYRLLTVLQDGFPLLADTLGHWEFNQLATRYLTRFPSRRPYLDNLADMLPDFIRQESADRKWIQIVDLETAFLLAFRNPEAEPFDPRRLARRDLDRLDQTPLRLHPALSLIEEDWNLMERRESLLRGESAHLACVERKGYWVVSRRESSVEWKRVESAPFMLLRALDSGHPLGAAIERTARALGEEEAALSARISGWFAEWIGLKWFSHPGSKPLVHGKTEKV